MIGHCRISSIFIVGWIDIFPTFWILFLDFTQSLFFINTILWSFFLLVINILLLHLCFGSFVHYVRRHWCENSFFTLPAFLLFVLIVDIRIHLFFLNHSYLLFPNVSCTFFKLGIDILQFITICCISATAWINWKDTFVPVAWDVLLDEVVVESDPLAVLFDRHTLDVSVLHRKLLLLFENHFLLPTLFDAKL